MASLYFTDTQADESSNKKTLYKRKRCILDKESTTSDFSAKVAKIDDEVVDDENEDYGGKI